MFYSLKTGGFYDSKIHGKNMPSDVIKISKDQHRELLKQQSLGKQITVDEKTKRVVATEPAFDFIAAQEVKRAQIRKDFVTASRQPITDDNKVKWNGGFDSALKIDGAKRLAESAGLTKVVLFDASNQPHTLTLAKAGSIAIKIGAMYQAMFTLKQSLIADVDALNPSASTQLDLDAIAVDFSQ